MNEKIEIINNWNLKKVFDNLENGNIKIPKFQREYVWERSKIAKLLNSIYCQYPIGSFFIWQAGKEYKDFCKDISELNLPIDPESSNYSFILDGQQRITSLYIALKGKVLKDNDYSAICFNLDKKCFQIPRLKNEKNNIPAWKLFDTNAYGDTLTDLAIADRNNETTYAATWRECQQIFSDYPISIIKSLNMNLEEVVDIFERINQGGKRLSLFDLVSASVWSADFDLREKILSFNKEFAVSVFGSIDDEVFTQSLSLNACNDCTNQTQLRLTTEDCLGLWDKTAETLRLSIDYIKTLGVPYVNYIPYISFLPLLQYYFFKSGRKSVAAEHKSFIENWFWTSTFSQRYSSSSLTKMKDDADWMSHLVSGELVENVFGVSLTVKELSRIRMNNVSVIKNGILCLMALKTPVDFDNGQPVVLDKTNASRVNAKENHHFFPFSLQKDFHTDNNGINLLMNFAFISKRLNGEILNKRPERYLADYTSCNPNIIEHLKTHYIDDVAYEYAKQNDYESFIQRRAELVLDAIRHKVKVVDFATPESEIIEDNID